MSDEAKFFQPKTEKIESQDIQAITAGPYPFRSIVDIHAFHTGGGGGDESTAFLELYIDGVLVGRKEDHHFNTYCLTMDRRLWLEAKSQIAAVVKGGNDKATTWRLGIDGWVTPLG